MTILISGATGFLGSYLLKLLIEKNYKVIALKRANSDTYRINTYLERALVYNIDDINISEIFDKYEIDIVINTVTNYGRKSNSISSIVDTNVVFVLKLLEISVNRKIKAFINADTLLNKNISPYALSKSQLVDWMKFLQNENTKMVNIKIEHMYGPKDDENKFIYWLINQLKLNVETIDLTLGIQKRDFVYIDDVVDAYEKVIQNIDSFLSYEEFELGSGVSIEVKNFVKKIYSELQKKQQLTTRLAFGAIEFRDNENINMKVNISKLNKLGWIPKVSIEEGIRNIISGELQ